MPVDISDYKIDDAEGGRSAKTIESGSIIKANGYYVVYLDNVSNNDDDVRLINKFKTIIDSFVYNITEVDKSWCRILDGKDWSQAMCQNPTQGLKN